jgi:hypothetical protein
MAENQERVFPFLPKTGGEDQKYAFQGDIGSWSFDPDLLKLFPADILVGEKKVESYQLTSIPDIWARAHFFHYALLNTHHPAHESIANEWKGLLGVIFLADNYRINLIDRLVDLNELANPEGENLTMARYLRELAPAAEFRQFRLINADLALIGATSPFSFVFVPPDHKVPEGVPWQTEEGRLTDPVPFLKSQDNKYARELLGLLKAWIALLRKEMVDKLKLEEGDQHEISARLKEWHDAIPGATGNLGEKKGRHTISLMDGKIVLDSIPEIEGGPEESKIQIQLKSLRTEYLTKHKNSPVVYWSEGWKEKRQVWRNFTTDSVKAPVASDVSNLLDNKIPIRCIDPERLFFTETIVRTSVERPAVRSEVESRYLLPLKSVVLEFFSAEFLAANFELREEPDETVTAELRIPLTGGDRAIIRRRYLTNRISTVFDRDAVMIWPNVRLSDWQCYYLFAHAAESRDAGWRCTPAPVGSAREELAIGGGGAATDDDNWKFKIWRLAAPPDAIVFQRNGTELGLCLPRFAEDTAQDSHRKFDISFDFGTSNSSVAIKAPDHAKPEPLHFVDRRLVILNHGDPEVAPSRGAMFFITSAADRLQSPFPSVYNPILGQGGRRAFLDGNIPFDLWKLYSPDGPSERIKDPLEYKTQLKWEPDAEKIIQVQGYLSQALLMAFCEARLRGARELTAYWTHPSAFERGRRERFNTAWQQIATDIQDLTGLKVTVPSAIGTEESALTESISVCRFAQAFHETITESEKWALVTIDVGGGTTDVAIWRRGTYQAQSSFLLAGDILTQFIASNAAMGDLLFSWAHLEDPTPGLFRRAFANEKSAGMAINELFRQHGDIFAAEFRRRARATDAERRAVSIAVMLLGGLAYYSALMLRATLKEATHKLDGATLLYAGNVSRTLKWFGDEPQFAPLMGRFFLAAYGEAIEARRIKVEASELPKMEVALGVLTPLKQEESIPKPCVIAGEKGILPAVEDDELADLALLSGKELTHLLELTVTSDLPVLRKFIEVYNKEAEKLDLEPVTSDIDFSIAKGRIDENLHRYARDPESNTLNAPFITGLSWLLSGFARTL